MKQEKNPTKWSDITDADDLQPWQKQTFGRVLRGGIKKGELIILAAGRRTGKSYAYMAHNSTNFAMNMSGTTVFGSPWDEWEDVFVWPWDRKTSVESGERVWGRIKVRYNKIVWEANGKQKQYATKKEVFQRKLKGID